jgi:predicted DNA-binding transcriptional regulator YafY
MSKRESLARLNLIIRKVRRTPSSFEEISDYLARESEIQSYNFNTSKRTFQRDLEDIRSLFDIDIQYDTSRKVYHIAEEDQPEMNDRMLEAFDLFNVLNVSERLSRFIYFEKRRPKGTDHLFGLLHAIKNHFRISFFYQKFWDDEATKRNVEPYALKEFRNRWYLVAKDLNDNVIKTFGLDRIADLEISRTTFSVPENFSIEEKFRYCFGIISPEDEKPEEIILSFEPIQGKYIKTLPLHENQQVILDNEDEVRVKLNLFITHDLIMELLSYGDTVMVLKPERLAEEIQTLHIQAASHYSYKKKFKDTTKK